MGKASIGVDGAVGADGRGDGGVQRVLFRWDWSVELVGVGPVSEMRLWGKEESDAKSR
jgi:hypothetical protein